MDSTTTCLSSSKHCANHPVDILQPGQPLLLFFSLSLSLFLFPPSPPPPPSPSLSLSHKHTHTLSFPYFVSLYPSSPSFFVAVKASARGSKEWTMAMDKEQEKNKLLVRQKPDRLSSKWVWVFIHTDHFRCWLCHWQDNEMTWNNIAVSKHGL